MMWEDEGYQKQRERRGISSKRQAVRAESNQGRVTKNDQKGSFNSFVRFNINPGFYDKTYLSHSYK